MTQVRLQVRVNKNFKEIDDKNVSMTLSNVQYNKSIDDFLVENIMETHYEFDDEKTLRHRESGKIKYLQQTLK